MSQPAILDECSVFGDAAASERCDLAIEVIGSSGGFDTLEMSRKVGVAEVRIWKSGRIDVFVRRGPHSVPIRHSVRIERNGLLPGIDLSELVRFIDIRPMTRAVTECRGALRGGC